MSWIGGLTAVPAAIASREIAIDAVIDEVVLDVDVNRFGDLERAVALDLDVADVPENFLPGARTRRSDREGEGGEHTREDAHRHAAGPANDTFGALWID